MPKTLKMRKICLEYEGESQQNLITHYNKMRANNERKNKIVNCFVLIPS